MNETIPTSNLQRCTEAIAAVQEQLQEPLEGLMLHGINWWLLLRSDLIRPFTTRRSLLYRKFLRSISHTDPIRTAAQVRRRSLFRRRPKLRQQGAAALISWGDKDCARLDAKGVEWLHYGLFRDHNEFANGALFNRIADSWIAEAGLHEQVRKVCPYEPNVVNLEYALPPVWVCAPETTHDDSIRDSGREAAFARTFNKIEQHCGEKQIPLFTDYESFLIRINACLRQARVWESVIEVYSPRFLALSSFYTEDRLPILIAAARRRIPVCELEHGFTGRYSPYAHLHNLPASAYALLPRLFWCWGAPSAQFLTDSLGSAASKHGISVQALGSPWHTSIARTGNPPAPLATSEHLTRKAANYQRRLLIVHQPDWLAHDAFPQLLPQHVWQVMRESDKTLWLLRLHPRSRHLAERFEEEFRRNGISHYDIKTASAASLSDLLPITDGVLTSFSTIALEFHSAGKPFYVIDRFGAGMLEPYLQAPYSFVGDTYEALSTALRQSPQVRTEHFPYVELIVDARQTMQKVRATLSATP